MHKTRMYKYGHGGNAVYEEGRDNIVDLSANINPLGMPIGVRDAISRDIGNCDRYPDSACSKLRERLAEYERVAPEMLFCGNGASDIIFRLPKATQAKRTLVAAPTFSDYERASISFGADVCRHQLLSSNGFASGKGFEETLAMCTPDLVFLCNPNNPTGVATSTRLIGSLLKCARESNTIVVVDECFLDFVENPDAFTSKSFVQEHRNLVIIKAFTKIFAMPGIRLGYAICSDKKLIDSLYFHGADWPVSNLAQTAAIEALAGADDYIKQTVRYVSQERETMKDALARLGYVVFDSAANYVFFRNPFDFDLGRRLDEKGIRIRECGDYHGLDGSFYRAAISTKENNSKLISAMEYLMQSAECKWSEVRGQGLVVSG